MLLVSSVDQAEHLFFMQHAVNVRVDLPLVDLAALHGSDHLRDLFLIVGRHDHVVARAQREHGGAAILRVGFDRVHRKIVRHDEPVKAERAAQHLVHLRRKGGGQGIVHAVDDVVAHKDEGRALRDARGKGQKVGGFKGFIRPLVHSDARVGVGIVPVAGEVLQNARNASLLIDGHDARDVVRRGLRVLTEGGGVAGAAKYILPGMMREMRRSISTFSGRDFDCLQMEVCNLMEPDEYKKFLEDTSSWVEVPFTDKKVSYDCTKRIGVAISTLGANKAIALGAYAFALQQIDKKI